MGERKLIQQRCLAVQLVKKEIPVTSPASSHSSSGDTTTPTNDPVAISSSTHQQDGYSLFLVWQAANVECSWDEDLVQAARAVQYLGHLVGGVVLVGGPPCALATLTLAWSRSLLAAPSGYTLAMLGEVRGWSVAVVPQGQFTPLADALCWVVHHLTREGCKAGAEAVRTTLEASFPTLMAPAPAHVHATLSSLIQQCKVYYTGSTYGIVQPGTYRPSPALSVEVPILGGDGCVHAAVQTDLAELITGDAQSSDTVITPTLPVKVYNMQGKMTPDLAPLSHHHHHSSGRTASLRLSPTRASFLASHLAAIATVHTYQALDFSDINIKGERGSVFSKLLRVPGRRRIATFAAQFPPPEWSDNHTQVLHLHSVAVQTSTQDVVKAWQWSPPQWTPRSATLPRRLRRPQSSTPPLPKSQQSSPVPRGSSSLVQLHKSGFHPLGASRAHSLIDRKCRNQKLQSSSHQRIENRSCHSSSSEDITDHRQRLPPTIRNLNCKRNQSGEKPGHKSKELGSVSADLPTTICYKQQPADPSISEEKLIEMMNESHIKISENEMHSGRQQTIKQRQEKVTHNRWTTNHSAHSKHAKARKNRFSENKFEKNQQGGDTTQSVENHNKSVSQEEQVTEKIKKKVAEVMLSEGGREHQYQRSSLQLELTSDHMNNCRKVVASPQRPHGLTTNLLHQTADLQHITKGSTPDLTSRNLGYQDVDKCHKKLCTQTLDQVQKQTPPTPRCRKMVPSPGNKGSPANFAEGEAGQDRQSVSTYPSLSELNLTFSSLAAQKILSGASVNSLDTLAEVNLAALKRNTSSVSSALTNTDLGFV